MTDAPTPAVKERIFIAANAARGLTQTEANDTSIVERPTLHGTSSILGSGIVTGPAEPRNGFMPIPDGAGIGVELVRDAEKRFPERRRRIQMRPHHDGAVVDM